MIHGEVKIIKIDNNGSERIVRRISPAELVKPTPAEMPFLIRNPNVPAERFKTHYTPQTDGTQ